MSVSVSFANFIVAALKADAKVNTLVSGRIWDHPPTKREFPYISLGEADFSPDDAECIRTREETLQLDCWTRANGRKWPCKQIMDAVLNVMRDLEGDLAEGYLVGTRIEIARTFNDPDGITVQGVVQVTGLIDEVSDDG